MAGDITEADSGHRLVAWERVDESAGHSVARVGRLAWGWRCHGTEVLAGPRELLSCWFHVDLDEDWVTREVVVSAVADGGRRTLTLSADDQRRWKVNGRQEPDLDGCIDVDVAATPLTNTFPIRRLAGLEVGRQVTTPIANPVGTFGPARGCHRVSHLVGWLLSHGTSARAACGA